MLVEVELDLLISNVDAQLLKRVPLEVLKPEYVEDPDVQSFLLLTVRTKDTEGELVAQ